MSGLDKLKHATQAAYQAEQAKLRDIVRQETELRRALADLDARRQAAQALPADDLAAPRAIGADVLWQGWTQRTRRELNVRLAQVLVRKADRMSAMTQAFGRAQVAAVLVDDEKTALRRKAQDREQLRLQELALLRRYMS
ncbi:hypothetical protein DC366_11205 [Pelagivirga sediminicola]|uniref:Flagellar FliJ protein n=1 Tax=Pelagivirga sediminicola TaxID=2170575 RepID=A0A2T7G5I9_9RHOB|nr:hypothetical protein [Pelagivirga sediminicola]PVA09693.1 hypothetical protein DC366_11205 [Pelagivirga sediminicola]